MKKLWNDEWFFAKKKLYTTFGDFEKSKEADTISGKLQKVTLPHDYLIYDTNNLYEDSTAFYLKKFTCSEIESKNYTLYFEGIYMDSSVYVNGNLAFEWKYGYTTFCVDITKYLVNGENEVVVVVNYASPNTRWYSGAGIYRDVYLIEEPKITINDTSFKLVQDSIYVHSAKIDELKNIWQSEVCFEIEVKGILEALKDDKEKLTKLLNDNLCMKISASDKDNIKIFEVDNKEVIGEFAIDKINNENIGYDDSTGLNKTAKSNSNITINNVYDTNPYGDKYVDNTLRIELYTSFNAINPHIWDMDTPNLYYIKVCLEDKKNIENIKKVFLKDVDNISAENESNSKNMIKSQTLESSFGYRELTFDTNKGLFLNGRHVKIQGVCEHHDLGCLGAAYNEDAMTRKLVKLREMGVNAIRTAHNPPAVSVMNLCDKMGFLVMSEIFDMWERPKNENDYARFFSDWSVKDVASWIRRDRNHPCVIMWSIGNEIYDTHVSERGQVITRYLQGEVQKHDRLSNAKITMGSNFMPWENARKCADILKCIGYNYAEKYYDEHHKEHADWAIYGSETSSTVQSRNVYKFPLATPHLTDDDLQCSCIGNATTSWGAENTEYVIKAERDHDFSLGQFLWTGFDYIGEPTPYSTKNSYFGQLDTAGFPKDTFYMYKSNWVSRDEEDVLYVYPYWNFNRGQMIDVRIVSNAPVVELFVNDKSLGKKTIDHAHGDKLSADYRVPYEEGFIKAVSYDENGNKIQEMTRHSFSDAVSFDVKKEVYGELSFFEITALDKDGYVVEDANNSVVVDVKCGILLGTDNGDSSDYDSYQSNKRKLFRGKLLVVAKGKDADLSVSFDENDNRIRDIMLSFEDSGKLNLENRQTLVRADFFPRIKNASEIKFKAINDVGIESNIVKVEKISQDDTCAICKITALGDGDVRLRAYTDNGSEIVSVISEIEMSVSGMGQAMIDPYSFVYGASNTRAVGDTVLGFNNGIGSKRDAKETVIIYDLVNFGDFGSGKVTIPIYDLIDRTFVMKIYDGVYGEKDARCIFEGDFVNVPKWQEYQDMVCELDERISGIRTISFVIPKELTIGGFVFEKAEKAYSILTPSMASTLYGDSYEQNGSSLYNIGNNVSIVYKGLDFTGGASKITIRGRSHNDKDAIHMLYKNASGDTRLIMEFEGSSDFREKEYVIPDMPCGVQDISIVFLPGTKFDLDWIRFDK